MKWFLKVCVSWSSTAYRFKLQYVPLGGFFYTNPPLPLKKTKPMDRLPYSPNFSFFYLNQTSKITAKICVICNDFTFSCVLRLKHTESLSDFSENIDKTKRFCLQYTRVVITKLLNNKIEMNCCQFLFNKKLPCPSIAVVSVLHAVFISNGFCTWDEKKSL